MCLLLEVDTNALLSCTTDVSVHLFVLRHILRVLFCVFLFFFMYSGVGAEVKNQLLVMRALANTFSKSYGAQFMCDEQRWVRLCSSCVPSTEFVFIGVYFTGHYSAT